MAFSCQLSKKPWALALIVIIVIGSVTLFACVSSRSALETTTRAGLESTAAVMATQINASDLTGLEPGDETSPEYLAVVDQLRIMRSMDDTILNAYILRVNPDQTATFLVDDLMVSDPSGSALIGEVSTDPNREAIFTAQSVPTSSKEPYTTKYGSFMSAYAPIDDSVQGSTGNTVAVLAIDIASKTYTDAVNASSFAILASGFASILISLGIIFTCCPTSKRENE